jgi:hypothetical protein
MASAKRIDGGTTMSTRGKKLRMEASASSEPKPLRRTGAVSRARQRPEWRGKRGEVYWGSELVKRVRDDAILLRCILTAFQKQGWISPIKNPLPQQQGKNRKTRQRDAIKSLNKLQKPLRIRFRCDRATGGIGWEIA